MFVFITEIPWLILEQQLSYPTTLLFNPFLLFSSLSLSLSLSLALFHSQAIVYVLFKGEEPTFEKQHAEPAKPNAIPGAEVNQRAASHINQYENNLIIHK